MSEPRFGGSGRPFDPSEVAGVARNSEVASDTEMARVLERFAARTSVPASPEFSDRVMAAIANEPAPAPARLASSALRHGAVGGFLAALGDAWRVATGPGFPVAARAQAAALVLVVVVVVGGSGFAAAGVAGLLFPNQASPSPTVSPDPSPSPSPSLSPTPSPSPSPSATPSEDPPASPSSSPEVTESPDASHDNGGAGRTETPGSTDDSGGATETRTPASTDDGGGATETEPPGSTDDSGDGSETLKPGETLDP